MAYIIRKTGILFEVRTLDREQLVSVLATYNDAVALVNMLRSKK